MHRCATTLTTATAAPTPTTVPTGSSEPAHPGAATKGSRRRHRPRPRSPTTRRTPREARFASAARGSCRRGVRQMSTSGYLACPAMSVEDCDGAEPARRNEQDLLLCSNTANDLTVIPRCARAHGHPAVCARSLSCRQRRGLDEGGPSEDPPVHQSSRPHLRALEPSPHDTERNGDGAGVHLLRHRPAQGRGPARCTRTRPVVAFMDRYPRHPGHLLLCRATTQWPGGPGQDHGCSRLGGSSRPARTLRRSTFRPRGDQLLPMRRRGRLSDGSLHLHLHVLPRYTGERLDGPSRTSQDAGPGQAKRWTATPTPSRPPRARPGGSPPFGT